MSTGTSPVASVQLPAVSVPTPTPITKLGWVVPSGFVSTAEVRVTTTVPPGAATLKSTDADCRTPPTATGTVPGNVSRTSVGVVVVEAALELPLHPAQM